MATRANTKTAPKKNGKPAESSSAAGKSSLRKGAPVPATPEPEAAPKPPKAPQQPAISLIDEPVKAAPRTAEMKRKFTGLPPISKIRGPFTPPEPTPEPVVEVIVPEPVVAEVIPEPAVEEIGAEEDTSKIIHIKPPIIVRDLALALGLKPFQVLGDLLKQNILVNINQAIEADVATKVCALHGFVFEKDRREKGGGVHKAAVIIEPPKAPVKPKADELKLRAPIVTFMGHVDHGKTSLMDTIRKARVAAGEAGGITQHIGAYSVPYKDSTITFLDTPGHEAFTAMRARGANVTDIVVLVVAADDGLMPQTLEAINHAKAAKVTIIVAINKIDLPSANIDRVKKQLGEKGLNPEDWGGDTIVCPVSATKGTGVPHLLEMIQLQSEVLELKASNDAVPRCTVIEAQLEAGRGPTGTVIVRMGTLKVGAPFICGSHFGKVKSLIDDQGRTVKEAPPAMPVKVLGFSGMPNAGDELVVMDSERAAKALGEERTDAKRTTKLAAPARATLENLFQSLADSQHKCMNIVLKSDVQGSLEALITSLDKIDSKKIDLAIIHSAVGPVTESDILLATASNAVVVGFNVKVESSAANAARREGVQIKLFSIIYELIDQMKEAMAGLLDPEVRETVLGHAEVKKVFDLSKGVVAGCQVTDGRLQRNARARVLRGKQPIYDGGFATMKRFQDDVKEVRTGLECGLKLGDFNDYEPGDVIQCYQLDKVPQKL